MTLSRRTSFTFLPPLPSLPRQQGSWRPGSAAFVTTFHWLDEHERVRFACTMGLPCLCMPVCFRIQVWMCVYMSMSTCLTAGKILLLLYASELAAFEESYLHRASVALLPPHTLTPACRRYRGCASLTAHTQALSFSHTQNTLPPIHTLNYWAIQNVKNLNQKQAEVLNEKLRQRKTSPRNLTYICSQMNDLYSPHKNII